MLVHARALLTGTPEGATAYIDADVRDPEKILDVAAETLDFTRPIALMLLGIMGNIADHDEAYAIVAQADATPSRPAATWRSTTAPTSCGATDRREPSSASR